MPARNSLRGLGTTALPTRCAARPISPRVMGGLRCASCLSSAAGTRRPLTAAQLPPTRTRVVVGRARGFRTDVKVGGSGLEPPPFAFAFDIDGVLLHVAKPIPGAAEVLRFLNDYNIPFILLTNGGGKHERDRVRDLSEKLGVQLSTDNFVQSHTPFQELLEGPDSLRDKTVLVTGSDYEKCRAIFKEYGFQNVVTPADIFAADPTIFPFQSASSYPHPSQPLPKPLYNKPTIDRASLPSHLKIDAIFVLNDPRDWALDTQIITDLLLSHAGYLGTYSPLNGKGNGDNGGGWQQDGQPRLYFSNADLLWSAAYHLPRLGQGAFQAALAGLWRRITGGAAELRRTSIGKPFAETYRFAERVLAAHRRGVLRAMGHHVLHYHHHQHRQDPPADLAPDGGGSGSGSGGGDEGGEVALRRVYMIGDNPESDIAGANGYASPEGTEWVPVLVRTGVWSEGRGGKLEGRFEPRTVADDVTAAVRWALRREGWHRCVTEDGELR
ncbi:HAD-superfamily hydrolase [Thermothelomyces heterothallicus CBS 203.75]